MRRRDRWRGDSVWRRARCEPSICAIWSDGRRARRKPALAQMGVDEIYLGKKQKFLTVVSNLESGEPLWFGRERKKETLDEFFQSELSAGQRMRIEAACVDMWEPFRLSMEQWAPNCRIVYDKFHIMQHANDAVDEVRRAEFFRKGGADARSGKGKTLAAVEPLEEPVREQAPGAEPAVRTEPEGVQSLPAQRESGTAVDYRYEGAMLNYLQRGSINCGGSGCRRFRSWPRCCSSHLDGILNYCRTKVPLGVVEAVNGNIKSLLRRGRGYKNLRYLLLKAQRMAATRTEFVAFRKAA